MTFQTVLQGVKTNTCPEVNLPGGDFSVKVTLPEVKELVGALATNRSVIKINLSRNNISDEEVKVLADALKTNTSVTHINLGWNKIGNEGATALARTLNINHFVRVIELWDNNIGDQGSKDLILAVKTYCSVSDLDLSGNPMSEQAVIDLIEVVAETKTITTLHLSRTHINKKTDEALANALEKNNSLTSISFFRTLLDALSNDAKRVEFFKKITQNNRYSRNQCHLAAQQGELSTLEKYLKKGVSLLSVTGEAKNTVLHWAVLSENVETIVYLLHKFKILRMGIAITNEQGKTPLDLAIACQHRVIAKMLLEATSWDDSSGSPVLPDNHLYSLPTSEKRDDIPLQSDRQKQWKDALSETKKKRDKYRELEEKCRIFRKQLNKPATNEKEFHEIKEAYEAAQKELEEVKQELTEAEENSRRLANQVEEYKGELKTLLHDKERLESQLAEINRKEEYLKMNRENHILSALFSAVDDNNKEAVEKMLDQVGSVNSLYKGATLLHHAVEVQSEEIISLLLERNANPNKKNRDHETPLHRAVRLFNKPIIERLVNSGADATTVVEFMKEQLSQKQREVKEESKGLVQGLGLVIRAEEDIILGKKRGLKNLEEIYSLLQQAAINQDPNIGYYRAQHLIDWELGELQARYETAIRRYPQIIQAYITTLDDDAKKIKQICDPIPLLKIDRKSFEKKIEEFFIIWKSELKKANNKANGKFAEEILSSSSSSASSPTSMISRPSSSMES